MSSPSKSSVLQHFYKKNQEQRLKDVSEFSNLTEEDLKVLKSDSALVRTTLAPSRGRVFDPPSAVLPGESHDRERGRHLSPSACHRYQLRRERSRLPGPDG